jgi:hypothetical protein
MIIDCAHYQDGRRTDEKGVPLLEVAARRTEGGFVWLGLFEPDKAEFDHVRDIFGLHELAVEDALNMHMRPKIERYEPDIQLVILRTARYDEATVFSGAAAQTERIYSLRREATDFYRAVHPLLPVTAALERMADCSAT